MPCRMVPVPTWVTPATKALIGEHSAFKWVISSKTLWLFCVNTSVCSRLGAGTGTAAVFCLPQNSKLHQISLVWGFNMRLGMSPSLQKLALRATCIEEALIRICQIISVSQTVHMGVRVWRSTRPAHLKLRSAQVLTYSSHYRQLLNELSLNKKILYLILHSLSWTLFCKTVHKWVEKMKQMWTLTAHIKEKHFPRYFYYYYYCYILLFWLDLPMIWCFL